MHKSSSASIGYSVVKKDSEDYTNEPDGLSDISSEVQGGSGRFQSIVNTKYKKPRGGSVQENLSKTEIKTRLVGYKSLKTREAKKYLLTLPLFKTWIKYYNVKTKQFRIGGLLMKVDGDLRYIMLVNTTSNVTWSVQLNDNIIFVPDPDQSEDDNIQREREQERENTKEKLYKLYVEGRLRFNRHT